MEETAILTTNVRTGFSGHWVSIGRARCHHHSQLPHIRQPLWILEQTFHSIKPWTSNP